MMSIPQLVKKIALLAIILCSFMTGFSQNPGKFKFENKEYYVYPYRVNKGTGIPTMGYKLPDGEYVVFSNYTFKRKFSFKKRKKYVLRDTSLVSAVINIKNNTVNGPAMFYERSVDNYTESKNDGHVLRILSGNFNDGLKDGVWKTQYSKSSAYILTTYKNGIEEGYQYDYNSKGILEEKAKYCNGERCDTVTEYAWDGRISKQYDICPKSEQSKEFSVYNKALDFVSTRSIPKAKTFYKSETNHIDLKFNNGAVLPFDSIGFIDSTYYKNVRYVSIHSINTNEMVLTNYQDSKYEKVLQKYYYKGDYLYRETHNKTRRTYKKKKRFSKTYIVNKEETVYTEDNYTDPKTIDMTSVVPVMVSKEYRETDTVSSWYIPKYQFAYSNMRNTQFKGVDTSRQWVYLTRNQLYSSKAFNVRNSSMFYPVKEKTKQDELFSPYKEKKYITGTAPDNLTKGYTYHSQNISRNYQTDNFNEVILLSTYSKNDVLFSGQYLFGDSRKETKEKIPGYTYVSGDNYYSNKMGTLTNGLKEGAWKELNHDKQAKYIPVDFKKYFFDNPKSVRSYNEFNYKNGLLNGKCVYYKKTSVYPTPKSKHTVPKLYKETEAEFTNDTLNGVYKNYFADGSIQEEGTYVMGLPDGDYKEYNSPGEMSLFMQFDKGKLNGRFVKYRNKRVSCTANFENNRLKDTLIYFYISRNPMLIIHGHNDTLTKRLSYFNSAQLKEQVIFDDNSGYKLSKESISSESFIEILGNYTNSDFQNTHGQFKNYYDNGQVLSEGAIKNGQLSGPWTFYSINGVAIHKVNFADTTILLPGGEKPVAIAGFYTGYYVSGKKRCEGYIKDLELSFDCFTKQDKADLDFYITTFYDTEGTQTVTNGTGQFIKFDVNGSRMAMGHLINCLEDSLWRYYTPDQKLTEIGHYVNHKKDGVWYSGDLEGINFEDGACFDMDDPDSKKAFLVKQKELKITQSIYKNGSRIKTTTYESNLNKEYKGRRRGSHGAVF